MRIYLSLDVNSKKHLQALESLIHFIHLAKLGNLNGILYSVEEEDE